MLLLEIKKSINVSSNLQKNLLKASSSIKLIVKKVDISKEQTFLECCQKITFPLRMQITNVINYWKEKLSV